MCLTLPLKIERIIGNNQAWLSDKRKVNTSLIKNLKVGDWVLANADLAISKISAKEAKEINQLLIINKI